MSMNEEQKQKELTFDESIKQVMQTLPPPIHRYLAKGGYSVFAHSLVSKHALHGNQGNILERELVLLLMGIETPSQFSSALVDEAFIAEDIVLVIMSDINQEIFTPLLEEMRRDKEKGQKSAELTAQSIAPVSSHQSSHLPESNKEVNMPESHPHLENKIPRTVTPPIQHTSAEFGIPPHLIKDFEQPSATSSSSSLRSPSHVAPLPPKAVMPHKDQSYGSPRPLARKRKPLTAPQPLPPLPTPHSPVPPPQNLPGVMPKVPKASINRLTSQQSPSVQTPDSTDVSIYSVDPYRESVDEN